MEQLHYFRILFDVLKVGTPQLMSEMYCLLSSLATNSSAKNYFH
jgi:hypothetical protein